jgi:hypothetical protein
MRLKWLAVLGALAISAIGLSACGGDDNGTSSTSTPSTPAVATTGGETSSGGATADDVYNACLDAIKGVPAQGQAAAKQGCQGVQTAFETCSQQASALSGNAKTLAVQGCQKAADKTTQALKSAQ